MLTKAHFNIYGLSLEISADHPLLLNLFLQDLRTFRVSAKTNGRNGVRLMLRALSTFQNGRACPAPFASYRELSSRSTLASGDQVVRYGRSSITIISRLARKSIQAAVDPHPLVLPDPAYHYCFTQPVNPWLKKRGLFPLHAGCVAENSLGILIIGQPRAGKSVLTVSAVREGFKFLGDEQPLLSFQNGTLCLYAFPRRIRLDRPVASIFPELRSLLESAETERVVFPIEKIWPGCLTPLCKPRLLIFPQFHPRRRLRLTRIHPSDALARLLQDDYFVWYRNKPWRDISSRHLDLFERLVHETRAFSLDYGVKDILKVPKIFRELLRG